MRDSLSTMTMIVSALSLVCGQLGSESKKHSRFCYKPSLKLFSDLEFDQLMWGLPIEIVRQWLTSNYGTKQSNLWLVAHAADTFRGARYSKVLPLFLDCCCWLKKKSFPNNSPERVRCGSGWHVTMWREVRGASSRLVTGGCEVISVRRSRRFEVTWWGVGWVVTSLIKIDGGWWMVVLLDISEHFAPLLNYLHKWAEPMTGPFLHCCLHCLGDRERYLFLRPTALYCSLLTSNSRKSDFNYIVISLLSCESRDMCCNDSYWLDKSWLSKVLEHQIMKSPVPWW